MKESKIRRALLGILILLAMAASLTHPRLPFVKAAVVASSAISFLDLILVSLLFMRRKTALYGYLLNGIFTLFGTVFMGHYSIDFFLAKGEKIPDLFLNPGFEGILIAWADFFAGYVLYRLWMMEPEDPPKKRDAAVLAIDSAKAA